MGSCSLLKKVHFPTLLRVACWKNIRRVARLAAVHLVAHHYPAHHTALTYHTRQLGRAFITGRLAARGCCNIDELRRNVEEGYNTIRPQNLRDVLHVMYLRNRVRLDTQRTHTDPLDIQELSPKVEWSRRMVSFWPLFIYPSNPSVSLAIKLLFSRIWQRVVS